MVYVRCIRSFGWLFFFYKNKYHMYVHICREFRCGYFILHFYYNKGHLRDSNCTEFILMLFMVIKLKLEFHGNTSNILPLTLPWIDMSLENVLNDENLGNNVKLRCYEHNIYLKKNIFLNSHLNGYYYVGFSNIIFEMHARCS